MNLIKRLIFKFSVKRKQCKCCGKTFYNSTYTIPDNNPMYYDEIVDSEDWVSPCCYDYWIEV